MREDEQLREGTVQHWDLWRGFGFISPDDPESPVVHVHATRLDGFPGYPHLIQGERVLYEAKPGDPGPDGEERLTAVRVLQPATRLFGTVENFDFERGFGTVSGPEGERFFLHHTNIMGEGMRNVDPGDEVTFEPGESERPDRLALAVKLCDPRKPLYKFADFPPPDRWLPALAELAQEEDWDYHHELAGRHGALPILRHYIEETFGWMAAQDPARGPGWTRLVEGGRAHACFNTGLASAQQESIYALFVEHRNPERTPWYWKGFFKESDRQLPVGSTSELPSPPDFFEEPARLLYDPHRELVVDYDHVVVDHLDRFPEPLSTNATLAQGALMGAVSRIPDRVRRNYKTAVPQHYRGQIQLLLPLPLLDPTKVDLALVVESRGEGVYRGNTVLGLDMAYRQARLVARPDPEWLGSAWRRGSPDQVSQDAPSDR